LIKTLQIVFKILLGAEPTSQAKNMGWYDLRMEFDVVPRAMPEIARITECVMHLHWLGWVKSQGVKL
jgi:hypothetical protein